MTTTLTIGWTERESWYNCIVSSDLYSCAGEEEQRQREHEHCDLLAMTSDHRTRCLTPTNPPLSAELPGEERYPAQSLSLRSQRRPLTDLSAHRRASLGHILFYTQIYTYLHLTLRWTVQGERFTSMRTRREGSGMTGSSSSRTATYHRPVP